MFLFLVACLFVKKWFPPGYTSYQISNESFSKSFHRQAWPTFDETKLVSDEIEVVFQINGKVRGKDKASRSISKEDLEALALENKNIKEHLEGLTVRKVIVIPGKLVNIVAN